MKFPVFNIADAALCIGVFLLAIYFIFIYTKEVKAEQERLKKEGVNLDENAEVYTDDLDKIKKNKFNILQALNIKKLNKNKKEKKLNVEAENDCSEKTKNDRADEEGKK